MCSSVVSIVKILFTLYLQCNQVLYIFAYDSELEILNKLLEKTESVQWPLQAGYPGLSIKNLNEYVSLFSHCLVNIQNYQGIEIIGIESPVYITRFDVAFLLVCDDPSVFSGYNSTRRFFFGRIPPKSNRSCSQAIKYTDKSLHARWYCTAQFDLFYPEPFEAPHIAHHSRESGFSSVLKRSVPEDRSVFDIASEYVTTSKDHREDWSKMCFQY